VAGRLLRTGAGKERPVEDRQLGSARRVEDGEREQAGILVLHALELEALIRPEGCESEALPPKQILGYGHGFIADR
jgi:hypothetical protein